MKNHTTIPASILVAILCAASPLLASASDHGNTSNNSSSDSRSAPASAPVERSAPVSAPAPAPVERSAPAAPVERSAPAAPVERSAPVERPAPSAPIDRSAPVPATPIQGSRIQPLPRQPVRGPVQPLPPYRARTPVRTAGNGGGQPAPNPQTDSSQWQWNGDLAWIGTNTYWGDGFWGPLEAGLAASAYIVAEGSPGAQLLEAYGLTQTPCGPPNLVQILGPGASEICAFPNAHVAPGVYRVDAETLTLISTPQ